LTTCVATVEEKGVGGRNALYPTNAHQVTMTIRVHSWINDLECKLKIQDMSTRTLENMEIE
jgi:hypothetical protein